MKKIVLHILLTIMTLAAWGQKVVVSGSVVNESTGQAIAGASVTMGRLPVVALTLWLCLLVFLRPL